MDTTAITALVGLASALLGMFFGYKTHQRGQRGENHDEGKQDGIVLTEIGYIKSGVDDIKREQREQTKTNTNTELFTRLAKVESSVSQAHKRIDRVDDTLKLERRNNE